MATQTQVTWYGHAAFKIITPAGNVLLIDPWLTNPKNPNGQEDLASLKRVDLVLLTHGHGDHVGDAVEIGKRTGAKLSANFDLASAMTAALGYPKDQAGNETCGHLGGQISILNGDVLVEFVPAWHGSSIQKDESSPPFYAGTPTGVVVRLKNGPTIYHTGDTCFFSDIARVADEGKIDIMMVCMGDHFTMGPKRAADAVKLVAPGIVVPMHYGTFPLLTGTVQTFAQELKQRGVKSELRAPKIGETISV